MPYFRGLCAILPVKNQFMAEGEGIVTPTAPRAMAYHDGQNRF